MNFSLDGVNLTHELVFVKMYMIFILCGITVDPQ
jgi:carotenoid cleavage dioxygenase-like enzyme